MERIANIKCQCYGKLLNKEKTQSDYHTSPRRCICIL